MPQQGTVFVTLSQFWLILYTYSTLTATLVFFSILITIYSHTNLVYGYPFVILSNNVLFQIQPIHHKTLRSNVGRKVIFLYKNGVFCIKLLLFLFIVNYYNTHICIHASLIIVLNRNNSVNYVNVCKRSIM